MQDVNDIKSPMEAGFIIGFDEHDRYVEDPKRSNQYRSLIGTLNFACTVCRFDIAYTISVLSRHLHRPTDRLLKAAYRVLPNLKTMRDFEITYTTLGLRKPIPKPFLLRHRRHVCVLSTDNHKVKPPRQIDLHE